MSNLNKGQLNNLVTPDTNIQELQTSQPKIYQAIKNLGSGARELINSIYPPFPQPLYRGRIIIPGNPAVANDILAHRYHVVMPIDPAGNWTFLNVVLTGCYITAKVAPTTTALSIAVLVSQKKGTTTFKNLFKPSMNPQLPINITTTHNVEFAINNLYQDDLGRVDVLAGDSAVTDIELVLTGYYNIQEAN